MGTLRQPFSVSPGRTELRAKVDCCMKVAGKQGFQGPCSRAWVHRSRQIRAALSTGEGPTRKDPSFSLLNL